MALTEHHQSQAGNEIAQYPRGSREAASEQGRDTGAEAGWDSDFLIPI